MWSVCDILDQNWTAQFFISGEKYIDNEESPLKDWQVT